MPAAQLSGAAGRWSIRRVASTGSTNSDLVAAARSGAPAGSVLVADVQTAGRGRVGRSWTAPAGTALTFSLLLRPAGVPAARLAWAGVLLGLAVRAAIRAAGAGPVGLKWPNDVLVAGRKCAGILAEMTEGGVVVGVGINVTVAEGDLPRADTTSLHLAGVRPGALDRDRLLGSVLSELGPRVDRWVAAGGDMRAAGLRAEYLAASVTVGVRVRIVLPGGGVVVGRAVDIDDDGAIVIDDGRVRRAFHAGDVVHLRPDDGAAPPSASPLP